MMPSIKKEELLGKINYCKGWIEKDEVMKDHVQPDMVPVMYYRLGLNSGSIALYTILVGNREEALEWFKKSAQYYQDSVKTQRLHSRSLENESGLCNDLLNSAVLSGEKSIIDAAVRTTLAIDKSFPEEHSDFAPNYFYVQALGHILMGENKEAMAIVNMINRQVREGFEEYFNGLRNCSEGVLKSDRKLVLGGLALILDDHYKNYGVKDIGPADEVLCIPATVQIKLAQMKGMIIKPEDIEEKYRRYIPWNLFD